jgi:DNA/RNA endonuclease YhcR with UshA esterase domain
LPVAAGSTCRHCGQLAGSTTRCAHCGMRLRKNRFPWLLRLCIFAGVLGALVLIRIQIARHDPPFVEIGSIRPSMNFSTVRVKGILESDARSLRGDQVLYRIDDGTGTLSVFLKQPPSGKLPKAGSRVSATGNLAVGAGNAVRMSVFSADEITIDAAERLEAFPSESRISDITTELKGTRMTVYGTVSSVWNPPPGSRAPHRIALSDPSGSIDVVHWLDPERIIAIGDQLQIKGTINEYKGRLQLKVWSTADIQPVQAPPAESEM